MQVPEVLIQVLSLPVSYFHALHDFSFFAYSRKCNGKFELSETSWRETSFARQTADKLVATQLARCL